MAANCFPSRIYWWLALTRCSTKERTKNSWSLVIRQRWQTTALVPTPLAAWKPNLKHDLLIRLTVKGLTVYKNFHKILGFFFLAHSNWKWAFLAACMSSVVCPSVHLSYCLWTFHIFIFFSRTTGLVSTNLGSKHHWVEGIHVNFV